MAFKVKTPHRKHTEGYYRDKTAQHIREKYKGKLPPFKVLSREGTIDFLRKKRELHNKGSIVVYKKKYHQVTGSNEKGVFLRRIKDDQIDKKFDKPFFVGEKKYEKEAVPNFIGIPI